MINEDVDDWRSLQEMTRPLTTSLVDASQRAIQEDVADSKAVEDLMSWEQDIWSFWDEGFPMLKKSGNKIDKLVIGSKLVECLHFNTVSIICPLMRETPLGLSKLMIVFHWQFPVWGQEFQRLWNPNSKPCFGRWALVAARVEAIVKSCKWCRSASRWKSPKCPLRWHLF